MKYNKIFSALAGLFIIGAASCTDEWNDHYGVGGAGTGESMMATLEQNPDLSNFVKVLKATGYDRELSGSQVFTTFAPTNASLTDEMTQQLIDSYKTELAEKYNNDELKRARTATVKQFVQNHIALYNYSVSEGMPDTTICMLNGKYVKFTKNAIGSNEFASKNLTTSNGVLFTTDKVVDFVPNLFEYVKMDSQLDSVSQFLYMNKPYQLHVDVFQPEQSVPGEIINGQQHYLDSVTVIDNSLLRSFLRARLDNEDSTYYALMPTNEAWKAQYDKIKEYYVFDKQVPYRDSLAYIYPRLAIMRGAQFSVTSNPKLGVTTDIDSIKSPLAVSYNSRFAAYGSYGKMIYEYKQPYAQPDGIFVGAKEVDCSNGKILKTDEWKVDPRNTYLRDIYMEAESTGTLDSLSGDKPSEKASYTMNYVTSDNIFYNQVSNHRFATLAPTTATAPFALFDFEGVLSNVEYDMYVTTVPAYAGDTLATDNLPVRFFATVYYHEVDGSETSVKVNNTTPKTDFTIRDGLRDYVAEADGKTVQKFRIGRFKFPTCSYGVDKPQVKVMLTVKAGTGAAANSRSKTLRIDQLSLEPVME